MGWRRDTRLPLSKRHKGQYKQSEYGLDPHLGIPSFLFIMCSSLAEGQCRQRRPLPLVPLPHSIPQLHRPLPNPLAPYQPQLRRRARKEGRAVAEHDRVQEDLNFIDEPEPS